MAQEFSPAAARRGTERAPQKYAAFALVRAVGAVFLFVLAWGVLGQAPAPDAVVAVVEGNKVTYKAIRMPEESLRLEYRLKFGKYPEPEQELDALARLSHDSEKALLTSKITAIVHRQQIKRFGITVTEEELDKRQRELLDGVDLQAALAEQREMLIPLIQALNAVLRKERTEKDAYDMYLSGRMPYEHWLVHKQYFNTPKRIAMLEAELKKTPEEWRKSDVGTRAWIEEEKLNEIIDAELAQTDPEFAKYYSARLAGDVETMSRIQGGNPNYVHAKREEWWRQQYAKADIQILDKKYADVLQRLVNPDASVRDR